MKRAHLTILMTTLLASLVANGQASESPGCVLDAGMQSGIHTMEFDGLERTFRIFVPDGQETGQAAPLVILFHGWSGDENDYLDVSLVREEADRRGYILVAPRGIGSGLPDERNNSWSFRGSTTGLDAHGNAICDDEKTPDYTYPSCRDAGIARNGCAWTHCQGSPGGDVDFTLALIDEVAGRLCVDTERVYATGSSNGGMFTWELAQNSSSAARFRAIAPNIGLPHRGYLDAPPRSAGMPALLTTGTLDKTVPPGEWEDAGFTTTGDGDTFYYASATAITRVWAGALGCSTANAAVPVNAGLEGIDCRSYCSSDPGLTRVLDCRAEMGHESGLDWSWNLILDFFDQHGGQ
jgi:poly(3-hydroxybutyrate) depolymerase